VGSTDLGALGWSGALATEESETVEAETPTRHRAS
jgi:hypothetical protein